MAILRSERIYPLALKAPAQYALNAGITAAYDYQGNPNNGYAGGNGAPHVGNYSYIVPANAPALVEASPGIFGRDPSVGKTVTTTYTGGDLLKFGIGSADGKGPFTIHRRYRMPTAAPATSIGRTIATLRDAGGTRLAIYLQENSAGYFYFRIEAASISIPSTSIAAAATGIRVGPGQLVDLHIVRDGDNVSWYLNGVFAYSTAVPALVTYNTAWAGSAPVNGSSGAPAQDLVLIDETYWNRALTATEISQHQSNPYAGYTNTAVVPDGLTVSNPTAGTTVNSEGGFTVGGTYSGSTTPTEIEMRFNGGSWAALTGVSIAGGNYSGVAPAISSGTGTLEVRMANATSAVASVADITAKPPLPTVAITNQPAPNGQTQNFTLETTRATSVTITLNATGNGAVTQGPTQFPVVNNAVSASMTAIPPGDYSVSISATGAGGTVAITGSPISILGVDGGGGVPVEDTTAPLITSATVASSAPDTVVLAASEPLDTNSVPVVSAFVVAGHTVQSVTVQGSAVNLVVTPAFANGEVPRTVGYAQPQVSGLRDLASPANLLASFSGLAITNNVAAPISTVTGVTINPTAATVAGGATQVFNATAQGTNNPAQTFTWTRNPAVGAITGNGTNTGSFEAPAATNVAQTIEVTATSDQDPNFFAKATVTVPAAAPAGTSFTRSIARTIKVKPAPQMFEGGPFWNTSNKTRPVGTIDKDETIDVSFDLTEVLADISDTVKQIDFDLAGLTSVGGYFTGSIATVFVSNAVPLGGGRNPTITCKMTTNSIPARKEDWTVELKIEEQ